MFSILWSQSTSQILHLREKCCHPHFTDKGDILCHKFAVLSKLHISPSSSLWGPVIGIPERMQILGKKIICSSWTNPSFKQKIGFTRANHGFPWLHKDLALATLIAGYQVLTPVWTRFMTMLRTECGISALLEHLSSLLPCTLWIEQVYQSVSVVLSDRRSKV